MLRSSYPRYTKYRYTFSDLIAPLRESRNISGAGLINLRGFFSGWMETGAAKEQDISRVCGEYVPGDLCEKPLPVDNWLSDYSWQSSSESYWHHIQKTYAICAICQKPTDDELSDMKTLNYIWRGNIIYCRECHSKLRYATTTACIGPEPEDYCLHKEWQDKKELLMLAKHLSPKDVVPSAFKAK